MKKILILLLLFMSFFSLTSCNETDTTITTIEVYDIELSFNDDTMYSLETGLYSNNINYSTSTRERVFSDSITVNDYTKASYILFWTDNNKYIGYKTLNATYNGGSKYLGFELDNTIAIPETADKIAFLTIKNTTDGYYKDGVEYLTDTYATIIAGSTIEAYMLDNQTIDNYIEVEGYTDLTYRDIFGDSLYSTGKTNLINNGDLSDGYSNWLENNASVIETSETLRFIATAQYGYARQYFSVIDNHIYYASLDYKVRHSGNLIYKYGFSESSSTALYDNLWNNASYILNANQTIDTARFAIRDYNISGWDYVYQDNFMIYDLTTLFDGYDIPTITQFEEMLAEYERLTQTGNTGLTLEDMNLSLKGMFNLNDNDSLEYALDITSEVDYYTYNNLIDNEAFIDFTSTDNTYYNRDIDGNSVLSNYYNAVGKNLFNNNDTTENAKLNALTGVIIDPTGDAMELSGFITIKGNTQYTISNGLGSVTYGHGFYDDKFNFISGIVSSNTTNPLTFSTPINTNYIRTTTLIADNLTTQLEEGDTATTYEEFMPSVMSFDIDHVGYVINDIEDTPDTQYINSYTLLSGDITGVTDGINVTRVYINTLASGFSDVKSSIWDNSIITNNIFIDGYNQMVYSGYDDTANIGNFYVANNEYAYLIFELGTSLATAQATLAGTVIEYELDTPIVRDFSYHNLAYYDTLINEIFDIDTDSDGMADNWVGIRTINESISGNNQYFKADTVALPHYINSNITDDIVYTDGDTITFNINIADISANTGIWIKVSYRGADGGYIHDDTFIQASDINIGDNLIDVELTEQYSTPTIDFNIGLCEVGEIAGTASQSFVGTTEDMEINYIKAINRQPLITDIDTNLDTFNYVETISLPDVTDTDYTDLYLFNELDSNGMTTEEYNLMINEDIDNMKFLPLDNFNITYFNKYLDIYYNDTYNGTTNFTYDDYFTSYNGLNPYRLQTYLGYTDTELYTSYHTDRDTMLSLYWDYKNSIDRWEWYRDYDITSTNYTNFIDTYELMLLESNTTTYADLSTMTVTSNIVVIVEEDDNIFDNVEDSLNYATDDSAYVFIIITVVIIVVSIIGLALLKADFKILLFIIIAEILLFTLIGWIEAWIALLIGIILFIIIVLKLIKKE